MHPLDAQWIVTVKNQNQGRIGACSGPCNSQRSHPQGRTVAHRSPLPFENSRAPHVLFLCHHTPFLVLKTKHLPKFKSYFLFMERSINSQDIPWTKGPTKIHKWRPLPSGGIERGIYDFCAGKPTQECASWKCIFGDLGPGSQKNSFSGSGNEILLLNLSLLFSNVGRTT